MSNIFRYLEGSTQTMSLTFSSVHSIALSAVGSSVLLTNEGAGLAYVKFDAASVMGVAGNALPILPNSAQVVQRDPNRHLFIGGRTDTGQTTTLKVTLGEGE